VGLGRPAETSEAPPIAPAPKVLAGARAMSDWGTRFEALEIIAAARNVSAETALALFCRAWNSNGLKLRFYQTTRNALTLELATWEEIKVAFLPRVTACSFGTGALSQIKEWLASNAITDVILKSVGMGMQSHTDPDGTIFWTRPWLAGYVPGDQWLQEFEVDLDSVRAAFLAPPSPLEIESAPSPSGTAGGKPRIHGDELTEEIKRLLKAGKKSKETVRNLVTERSDCEWREFDRCWHDEIPPSLKLHRGEKEPR
jgi:hypothetical protein